MIYEVEQKYAVDDLPQLENRIAALHSGEEHSIEQVDLYFAHPQKDYAQTDEALRIRRVGEDNFVTYKGPKIDTTTKTRREIEMPLPGGDSGFQEFRALLEALGFRPVREVRKLRRQLELPWQDRHIHLAIDQVASIGCFVELELVVEAGEIEGAKESISALASHLQLGLAERRSYLEMLIAAEAASRLQE
mgnify:CR=1 FL=1